MSRRTERILAAVAIALATAVAAFALLWHFAWDDAYWRIPPWPTFHPFPSGSYYWWMNAACVAAAVAEIAVAIVLVVCRGRRDAGRWLHATLPALVCVLVSLWAVPFAVMEVERLDRLRGDVTEPVSGARLFARMVWITCAASVVACASAGLRHTRRDTRAALRVVPAIICGTVIAVLLVLLVMPVTYEWMPADFVADDRLVAFVPCRSATVWARGSQRWWPVALVDDLWLRFDDPRAASLARAVSLVGMWRDRDYRWLTLPEAARFRVRRDDPHVVHCDQRWRTERVAPESWHKLGPAIW